MNRGIEQRMRLLQPRRILVAIVIDCLYEYLPLRLYAECSFIDGFKTTRSAVVDLVFAVAFTTSET
jgi:hypothetical protein